MRPIQLVYVAGPYRGDSIWRVTRNIEAAREVGAKIAQARWPNGDHIAYPMIPHTNTGGMDGVADDAFWLAGTMAMMRACKAVVMMPTWRSSSGARAEHAEAFRLGMPVLDLLDHVDPSTHRQSIEDWLRLALVDVELQSDLLTL